jgi:hypothetical protein
MENEQNSQNQEIFAKWQVPEYEHHHRDFRWYLIAIGIALALMVYSFLSSNFLLPFIIIITGFILVMQHGQEPPRVTIALQTDGITVGQKFYDYDEFNHFAIVYKPKIGDKNLYFEFKNVVKQRLSIPLLDMNPVEIRNFLLAFLKEDLDRTDIPLSEQISKFLKL